MQTLRPMILTTALLMGVFAQQGYDSTMGIDLHFITRAKVDQKKLIALESMASQAELLGDISDEDGDAMLSETLDGMRNGEAVKETIKLLNA